MDWNEESEAMKLIEPTLELESEFLAMMEEFKLLWKAQELGIERLLVTCDDTKMASAQVIEKNGGKLADKVIRDHSQVPIRRYWIDLAI